MQTAATGGQPRSPGSGCLAFAASDRTLPGVSAPSRVVRSTIEIAVSMAQALAVVLIDRVPSIATRDSAPTWSTPGRPWRNARNAASDRVTSSYGGGGAINARASSGSASGSSTWVMASFSPVGRDLPNAAHFTEPAVDAAQPLHRLRSVEEPLTCGITDARFAGE